MIETQSTANTVFVLDDEQSMRESIEWTLRNAGYDVQLFSEPDDCLVSLESNCPFCIVVDLLLPGMTGLKFCEKVKSRAESCFVMISGHGDVNSAVQAMKLGVVDFLEKPFNRESLLSAVHEAIELAQSRRKQFAKEEAIVTRLKTLSPREREIFDCLADGLITKQIASRLGISSKTVDVHRSSISQKLGLESPTQLAHVIYLTHCQRERQQAS
jgi:FixJ family two-component response regulator